MATTLGGVGRILDKIDADQRGAGTVATGWHKLSVAMPISAFVIVGEIASSATFDSKFQQAQDASGTGAKDLKAASQLGDTDDNTIKRFEVEHADLDLAGSFTHVRLSCTVAAANVDFAALLMQYYGVAAAPSDLDNGVDEFVT